MDPSPQEAERNRRRQRIYRRFGIVGWPIALVGALASLALDADWGMGVMSAGMCLNVIGYAVAPLLHPKPLSER